MINLRNTEIISISCKGFLIKKPLKFLSYELNKTAKDQKEVIIMNKYEVMYILQPNLEDKNVKKIIDNVNGIFTKEGKVTELKEMGLKELAYPIQKFNKGYYVWLLADANSTVVAEFTHIANISEEIMRYMAIKLEDNN
ncbi:MAG: 30S ribosomal protein S6 [Candidatus Phytoplasma pruni]|nr:MAG: 30S ribosomal protein S6 [Candidatus Phytoplasma pruni]